MEKKINLFWFRRDLRLNDNAGLYHALKQGDSVVPVFIFDSEILKGLPKDDKRVLFIHQTLSSIKSDLQKKESDLIILSGDVLASFKLLQKAYNISAIYTNHDYEPQAVQRDLRIEKWALTQEIEFKTFKDQCFFEKSEVASDTKKPYTVFTPYKKKWLTNATAFHFKSYPTEKYAANFLKVKKITPMISLEDLGFEDSNFQFPKINLLPKMLKDYEAERNFPFIERGTSRSGLHLRFGTVSIRELARVAKKNSDVWLSELIWRDFFMQILWHYPNVQNESFRPQYDQVAWRNNAKEFKKWCDGETGYPLVDAGMRELNETGHMHNRVRMVTASFLTKHLLMHWSLGERYFASKLLDYDLAANNGNWQWAAGTGCDAAPYFRIFNPETQLEKFDPDMKYVKRWVPEVLTKDYVSPMVDHKVARERALTAFKTALKK